VEEPETGPIEGINCKKIESTGKPDSLVVYATRMEFLRTTGVELDQRAEEMTALAPVLNSGLARSSLRQTRGTILMADRVTKTKRSSSSPVVPAIMPESRANLTLPIREGLPTIRSEPAMSLSARRLRRAASPIPSSRAAIPGRRS
jgi:hypothetical protein